MKILISDPISKKGMDILKLAKFEILDYQHKKINPNILSQMVGLLEVELILKKNIYPKLKNYKLLVVLVLE